MVPYKTIELEKKPTRCHSWLSNLEHVAFFLIGRSSVLVAPRSAARVAEGEGLTVTLFTCLITPCVVMMLGHRPLDACCIVNRDYFGCRFVD